MIQNDVAGWAYVDDRWSVTKPEPQQKNQMLFLHFTYLQLVTLLFLLEINVVEDLGFWLLHNISGAD